MPKKTKAVTPELVLSHLQAMQQTLAADIRRLGDELTNRLDRPETNLTAQIDGVDRRLDDLEIAECLAECRPWKLAKGKAAGIW